MFTEILQCEILNCQQTHWKKSNILQKVWTETRRNHAVTGQ